jgi:hypothetical protein
MNIPNWLKLVLFNILLWTENAVFLQAVCTLVSTPILYCWKMPCSKVTTLGNLIFSPFMASFIFLSGLIFLFSLFGLFPKIVLSSFEKFVSVWMKILKLGERNWLTIPGKLAIIVWLLGAIGTLAFVIKKAPLATIRRALIGWLMLFSAILILQNSLNKCFAPKTAVLYRGATRMRATTNAAGVTLVDQGIFARCQTPDKFIIFNLRPFLLEKFGHLNLQKLVFHNFSARTLPAALYCSKFLAVREIELPKNWQRSKFYLNNQHLLDGIITQIKLSGTSFIG